MSQSFASVLSFGGGSVDATGFGRDLIPLSIGCGGGASGRGVAVCSDDPSLIPLGARLFSFSVCSSVVRPYTGPSRRCNAY